MPSTLFWEELEFVGSRGKDFRIAAQKCGVDHGQKWLLLHGFLDSSCTWDSLCEHLVEQGTLIVAIDFAGHGKSSHVQSGTYHFMDHVADVAFVVHELGWAKFNVLGHSMGGAVASCLAAAIPEKVHRLIVIEALGPWTRPTYEVVPNFVQAITKKAPGTNRRIFATIEEAAQRRSEGNIVNQLPIEAARILCRRGLVEAPEGNGYVWASDSVLLKPPRQSIHEDHVIAYLSHIQAPTLLILAKDGLFKQLWDLLCGISPFGRFGRIIVHLIVLWVKFRYYVLGVETAKKHLAHLEWVVQFGQRKRHVKKLHEVVLGFGGHHPHLTEPKLVADAIRAWCLK
eukprot:c17665_g1_i1.p1 GENE.c17665_g1_i1~~c17665_g1_i1.p1  ORF type:complete len:356 (-),score=51.29 c17665_g1_i1:20-1042(-)